MVGGVWHCCKYVWYRGSEPLRGSTSPAEKHHDHGQEEDDRRSPASQRATHRLGQLGFRSSSAWGYCVTDLVVALLSICAGGRAYADAHATYDIWTSERRSRGNAPNDGRSFSCAARRRARCAP